MSRKTVRRYLCVLLVSVAGCEVSGNVRYNDPSTGITAEMNFKPKAGHDPLPQRRLDGNR